MRSVSNRVNASPANDVWFISFGDLLTLLVCFFLVLTPEKMSPKDVSQSKQVVNSTLKQLKAVGTELASGPTGQNVGSILSAPVWRDSLESEKSPSSLKSAIDGDWRESLKGALLDQAKVVVKLCDAASEREVIGAVIKQLEVDQNLTSLVSFEVGADCNKWSGKKSEDRALAAVLRFSKS